MNGRGLQMEAPFAFTVAARQPAAESPRDRCV